VKAYKITLLVIDHDGLGLERIREEIESAHYANHCISPNIKDIEERDIGTWADDHPLNKPKTCDVEYSRLFGQMVSEDVYQDALDRAEHLERLLGACDESI
jgi:hypothetical protein